MESAAAYLERLGRECVAAAKERDGDERARRAADGLRRITSAAGALTAVGELDDGSVVEAVLRELEGLSEGRAVVLREQARWERVRHDASHPARNAAGALVDRLRDLAATRRSASAPELLGVIVGPFHGDPPGWSVASVERWSDGGVLHVVGQGAAPPSVLGIDDDRGRRYVPGGGGGGGSRRLWRSAEHFTPAPHPEASSLAISFETSTVTIDLSDERTMGL